MPRFTLTLLSALAIAGPSWAQTKPVDGAAANTTPPRSASEPDRPPSGGSDEVLLSPFEVSTTKDKGYKATNSTAGTRLNLPIKELPLNLEVITSDFIRDTGATNLRDALRYSAGVVLESQSDAFVEPDGNVQSAGANDPRGATRAPGDSSFKLRGFVIDQVLRDGFRRQYSSDSVNVDRIEVLRGPSALLYGVGTFGGVINYLPKRPQQTEKTYLGLSLGSHGLFRAEFDVTGPLGSSSWKPAYRVTAAYQENGDYTDWYNTKHFTVSPVFSFKPLPNTEILIDNEFGSSHQSGVGFQNQRANINSGSSRTANWLTDVSRGVINTRTFRWSGPDTYLKGPYRNTVIDVTQKINDELFIRAGVAQSRAVFNSRQIRDTGTSNSPFSQTNPTSFTPDATISIGGTNYNLRSALTQANASTDNPKNFLGLSPTDIYKNRPAGSFRGDSLYGTIASNPAELVFQDSQSPTIGTNAAIRYDWFDDYKVELRNQFRTDINYKLDLGVWGKHNFVAGLQYMKLKSDEDQFSAPYSYANHPVSNVDRYSYKSPADYSPFRYGTQGDGRPDAPRTELYRIQNKTWDAGVYGVYQGQFFKDKLTIIGGARRDRDDSIGVTNYPYEGRGPGYSYRVGNKAPTATSPQVGVSFQVIPSLSLFALYSTGVVPNYTATDGNGAPFAPTKAKNYEAGIKFDVLDGRISGTLSAYKIKRTNTPKFLWWAPSPNQSRINGYNAASPVNATTWQYPNPEAVWYGIQTTGVDVAKKIFPSGYWPTLDAMAAIPAGTNKYTPGAGFSTIPGVARWWDGGIDTVTGLKGLMSQSNDNTNAGTTANGIYFPLVNFNDPAELAFTKAAKLDYTGWGGNFVYTPGQNYYYGDGTVGQGNAATGNGASVAIDDEAKGVDFSLIASVTDDLQLVFNYAHLKRKITTNTYKFVAAPYFPFGWWYVRDGNFGTLSYTTNADQVYTNITDTTTYHAQIPEYGQAEDDSPANQASLWARFSLDHLVPKLKGVSMGLGGFWEDRRQWFTGFTGGGGNVDRIYNGANPPVLVQLWTKTRTTINGYVEYKTIISQKYHARFAFNADNILDDQRRYGLIYASGASFKFTTGVDF